MQFNSYFVFVFFLIEIFNAMYIDSNKITEQHNIVYITFSLTHLSKKYKLQSILSLKTVINSFGIPISDNSLKTPFKA